MVKGNTKVLTGKVRLSYASLFEKDETSGKYSTVILIPKSDKKTLKALKEAKKAAYELGKDNKLKGLAFERVPFTLRDGDDPVEVKEENADVYAGHYFMNVSSATRPGVVDKDVQPILDSEEVYSGCYARVSLNLFAYNSNGNKGISAGLNNVQKLADGDPLGGRARAEDEFSAWEDDEEDDLDDIL